MAKKNTKTEKSDPLRITPEFAEIELNKIETNPWQPRKTAATDEELAEMMDSIKAVGQTSPIRVRRNTTKDGFFQAADGWMRVQSMRKLGMKKIRAIIEPLTDRQMKILAIAANTFIRLRDSDKEKAVYELWESEFKGEGGAQGRKDTTVFTGVREMERETGISQSRITGYLQSHTGRLAIMREAPKELKADIKDVSSRDMEAIAQIAKESTKIAQQLVQARASDTIKPAEVREIVKSVQQAAPEEREKVVQQIINAKREEQKAVEKVKEDTKARVKEIQGERKTQEERVKAARKADDEKAEKTRLAEMKQLEESRITKENVDRDVLQSLIKYSNTVDSYANDATHQRIANMSDSNKGQAAEIVKTIAAKWTKFAARFKEA